MLCTVWWPQVTQEEIKVAYRRLAMQWHPDRQTGKDERTRVAVSGVTRTTVCCCFDDFGQTWGATDCVMQAGQRHWYTMQQLAAGTTAQQPLHVGTHETPAGAPPPAWPTTCTSAATSRASRALLVAPCCKPSLLPARLPSPCISAGFACCMQAANNFAKLLKAYEVLGDEEQRRLYDRGDLVEATLSL